MKTIRILIAITALCLLPAGCGKGDEVRTGSAIESPVPVLFLADEPSFEAVTRATEVTGSNLSSFQVLATVGTTGSESQQWAGTSFSKSGSTFSGGKYWLLSNPSGGYHFYASNSALTFAAGGSTVSADSGTDIVCAYLPSPTFQQSNTLTFHHIFARIGQVSVAAAGGYAITDVMVKFTPYTKGKYNLRTGDGKNDGTGWSELASPAEYTVYSKSGTGNQSNDIYLVPGSYRMTATWTAEKGDYRQTYSAIQSKDPVSFAGGKINAVGIQLGGNAKDIVFSVSVTPWGNPENKTAEFPFE